MAECAGRGADHCCYIMSRPCPLLRDDGPQAARRWVCTVREASGSWARAYARDAYRRVRAAFDRVAPDRTWRDCGDFPSPGAACGQCGVVG